MKLRHSQKILAQALLIALASPALAAPPARQPAAQQPPARNVSGQINLNFKDAEVDSVIGAFGHLLNKSFVIDPRVRGKISLETPRPVNRQQAFTLLKTVLRQQGFAIVDLGDLYKVVPEADAKLQSGPVEIGPASGRHGDEVITQVFQLSHESANNMIPVLRPLVSPCHWFSGIFGRCSWSSGSSCCIVSFGINFECGGAHGYHSICNVSVATAGTATICDSRSKHGSYAQKRQGTGGFAE